jgi:hypothetical protein
MSPNSDVPATSAAPGQPLSSALRYLLPAACKALAAAFVCSLVCGALPGAALAATAVGAGALASPIAGRHASARSCPPLLCTWQQYSTHAHTHATARPAQPRPHLPKRHTHATPTPAVAVDFLLHLDHHMGNLITQVRGQWATVDGGHACCLLSCEGSVM